MQKCLIMKYIAAAWAAPLALAGVIATAPAAHADPARNWRPIQSHAPDASNASAGADMRAGEAVHVSVSLQARNPATLDALAASVAAGGTPLTSAQFLSQYAPTAEQVAAVVKHLGQSGFVNIEVSPNRLLVTADGTAGTAKSAFNVDMRHYTVGERAAFANINDPVVPSELSGIVLGVHGLQTLHLPHTALVQAQARTYATAGKTGHSPAAWPAIYNASGIPTAANTTIGIISAGDMTQTLADLGSFVRSAGFAAPAVSVVSVASASRRASASTTTYTDEWDIDSQDALGAAGGVVKSLVFYAAASLTDADLTAAFNAAVAANAAGVISVSLGECETNAKLSGTMATDDQIFKIAVAQGQTFVVSSGDAGSFECGGKTSAQSYPAVSPYVIAVGGTSLATTAAGVWSAETVWACSSAATCASGGGTGGGPSLTETAPNWQLSARVLGTSTRRGVPDIAFVGDPSSGAQPIVNGKVAQYGGTSLAAPIFAGFWARIQSAHGNKLAFPAAALYKYGTTNQSLFHDVVSGTNGGYAAAQGWDYTTGFGSLNVGSFAAFITASGGF